MKSLRIKMEVGLFWAPIAGALALTALAGGQVRSPAAMPASLSPAFFICGVALIVGAAVGILEPTRLKGWLRPATGLAWRAALQHLFALAFGSLLVVWALVVALRHEL